MGFVSLFIGTSADRNKARQERYRNSEDLLKLHDERFFEYCDAIRSYNDEKNKKSLDHFQRICVTGDRYLSNLNRMAAACSSGNLEDRYAREAIIPKILDNCHVIPEHYETLHEIGKTVGLPFPKDFERANYAAIFSIAEKYGDGKIAL